MKIEDLRIVVSGAASGIGRHFAERLVAEGARVAAVDVQAEGLAALAEAVGDGAERLSTHVGSVADEADVARVVAEAAAAHGLINGLINCAGIFRDGLLVKPDRATGEVRRMSLRQWQQVIDVNLTGTFLMTREVAAHMVERGVSPGVIVNISSAARHGNPGQSNYSATKAGVVADTKLWATELARYGVRVAAIAPGFTRTPILEGMRPEVLEKMLKVVPLGRMAEPEEMFEGLRFIVRCDYYTGRCLDIDGGLSL